MKPFYVYAIKNTETDKIITWRTNPPRKFWQRKSSAQEALNKGGDWVWCKGGAHPSRAAEAHYSKSGGS